MAQYNNLYNFKNTIRHFINIDALKYPNDIDNYPLDKLAWTEPIKYRIRKDENSFRTLKIPNILEFVAAYEQLKTFDYFVNPHLLDMNHKRLIVNVNAGEFQIGSFEKSLKLDFSKLCIYDYLIKLDIKEFYGRIYTHFLGIGDKERYLTNLNCGATNGLIMGNYLSLYWAEHQLSKISLDLESEFKNKEIDCDFSYFSDDFYFFCNEDDRKSIVEIFDRTLDKYDLERNKDKFEIWDYYKYNNYNVIEKYWKKIISNCNQTRQPEVDKKLVFINQLIYRGSLLEDNKQRRTLICGFFRTKYFRKDIDLSKYSFKDYDIHQLCYLFKLAPECLLYSCDRLKEVKNFDKAFFRAFFIVRYKESLKKDYQDEQLYYFYAMYSWKYIDELKSQSESVIRSKNQILISYYLMYGWISENQKNEMKSDNSEKLWFQNYHIILHSKDMLSNLENNVEKYLIPKSAYKTKQKDSFKAFYTENIVCKNELVVPIEYVCNEIIEYLDIRFAEGDKAYCTYNLINRENKTN